MCCRRRHSARPEQAAKRGSGCADSLCLATGETEARHACKPTSALDRPAVHPRANARVAHARVKAAGSRSSGEAPRTH